MAGNISLSLINLLFILLGTKPFPSSTDGLQDPGKKIELRLAAPSGCPIEFQHDVQALGVTKNENVAYNPGQNITLECNSKILERQLKISLPGFRSLQENKFLVFPESSRSCLADGTWSSKPPVCTWISTSNAPTTDFLNIPHFSLRDCSTELCKAETHAWIDVGSIDRTCMMTSRSKKSIESKKILYTFTRHFYLSFIIVSKTEAFWSVKVRVKKEDVLALSEESQQSLMAHYDVFRRVTKSEGCAVTQFSVYARQFLLEFEFEQGNIKLPQVTFYAIPEPGNSNKAAFDGYGCPKEPSIPNSKKSRIDYSQRGYQMTNVTYTCNPGYIMMDPITKNSSNGVLTCRNMFEWEPYPFPVCRKTHRNVQHYPLGEEYLHSETLEAAPVKNNAEYEGFLDKGSENVAIIDVKEAKGLLPHMLVGKNHLNVFAKSEDVSSWHFENSSNNVIVMSNTHLGSKKFESNSHALGKSKLLADLEYEQLSPPPDHLQDRIWTFSLSGIGLTLGVLTGGVSGVIYMLRKNIRSQSREMEIKETHVSLDPQRQLDSEGGRFWSEYAIAVERPPSFRSDEAADNTSNLYCEIDDSPFIRPSATAYRVLSEDFADEA